jgi:hypothetical protein
VKQHAAFDIQLCQYTTLLSQLDHNMAIKAKITLRVSHVPFMSPKKEIQGWFMTLEKML